MGYLGGPFRGIWDPPHCYPSVHLDHSYWAIRSLTMGRGLRQVCLRSLGSAWRGRCCAPSAAVVWLRTTVSALLTEVPCLVGEMLLLSQLLTILPCFGHQLIPPAHAHIHHHHSQRYLVPPLSEPFEILPFQLCWLLVTTCPSISSIQNFVAGVVLVLVSLF